MINQIGGLSDSIITIFRYNMMLALKIRGGYDAYLMRDSYNILRTVFTEDSIELPVLEDTFCDINSMDFKVRIVVHVLNITYIKTGVLFSDF